MKILSTYQKNNELNEKKFYKARRITYIVIAALLTMIISALTVAAAYDSGSDPLVTLSYLNSEKVKLKTEIENDILNQLGFSSFAALKAAINSSGGGTGGTVDTAAIVKQAKDSILSDLGFSTYSALKTAINTNSYTITNTDKNNINIYVQSSILQQLGLSTMSAFKTKINETYTLSTADITNIVAQAQSELIKNLGYPTWSSLKAAISDSDGGPSSTPADAVDYLLSELGYDTIAELQEALKDKAEPDDVSEPEVPTTQTNDYDTVTLSRGQTIVVNGICEVVLASGNVGVVGTYSSAGITDVTAGAVLLTGDLLETGHSYLVPVSDNAIALIGASSDAVLFVRGEYDINE
ncbi:MAG: hypothetical protein A2Y17_01900 [Clostridiales bacterium GWF2_38_85]|nr:MAG: hypothetical protein A2Y17_01900 [Clostridiales bacterium GWF2_38_85]HBL84736.1 hypothetical protein [Clostridiales bacterium]